jgi:hypothetical protein
LVRELLKPYIGPVAIFALKEGLSASGYPMNPFWGGIAVGFAGFWFILALMSHKALIKRFPTIREWLPFVDPAGSVRAGSKELTGRYVTQQHFAITELAVNGKIIGRTFEDCDIFGPAVLVLGGVGQMYRCTFDSPAVFIRTNQDKVVGPILITDCSFKSCRFQGVGFIGTEEAIKRFMSGTEVSRPASQSPLDSKRDQ